MVRRFMSLVILAVALSLVARPASAHTPRGGGDNHTLGSATVVPDATKSWAIYAELPAARTAGYYTFTAARGQRIPIGLRVGPGDPSFSPSLAVMGPGVPDVGTRPPFVEVPDGAGATVVVGVPGAAVELEPFSASVTRLSASISFVAPADGTFAIAVFDERSGGRYVLALGLAERFTPGDWVGFPFAFAEIYAWEGQSLAIAYTPAMLVVVIGGVLVARRRARLGIAGWLATIAGLSFVATGVTVAVQLIWATVHASLSGAALVTLLLAALPTAIGVATVRLARNERWTAGVRIRLALLGVAAAVFWAGWVAGPVLAIVAAVLPRPPLEEAAGGRGSPATTSTT